MRHLLITILSLVLMTRAFTQTVDFKWVKTFGSPGLDVGHGVTIDSAGNIYSIGKFSGTIDFDPGPGVHNFTSIDSFDIFILKQDGNGNLIWAKQIGGAGEQSGLGLTFDNTGNLYCSGFFQGTVDFDPGAGTFTLMATTTYPAAFLCKLTPAGDFLWAYKFNEGWLSHIIVDAQNNVHAVGFFRSTTDFDPGAGVFNLTPTPGFNAPDAVLLKFNSAGNFIWAKKVGGSSDDYAVSIAIDAGGSIYTLIRGGSPGDYDPGPGIVSVPPGSGSNVVLKLDAAGNFVWVKRFGGSTSNGAVDIKIDAAGNIYTSGVLYNTGDFDPGPGIYNINPAGPPQAGRGFICKWDASGNFLWAKNFGGPQADFCGGLALDVAGNVYTTGGFTAPADFDPGPNSYILSGNSTGRTAFVLKLDVAGNFVWAKKFGSTGIDNSGSRLYVDASQNIYTIGFFQGTADFDPETGVYNATAVGNLDIFIHKMSQCLGVTNATINASACNSYTINNQTFTSSGVYTQILTNASGCDSVITLNLTISGSTSTSTATGCDSYTWRGRTLTASGMYADTLAGSGGCDSILRLNLTIKNSSNTTITHSICEGESYLGYTSSGTYLNTFVAANGCDSVRTLNLSVKSRSYSSLTATICQGENYLGYTATGTYRDTLVNSNGCDSIRTLQLVVNPKKFTATNVAICEGVQYFAGGTNQTTSGTYKDTLVSATGCDSIITTNLLVHAKPKPELGNNKGLCEGTTAILSPGTFTTYLWHDQSTAQNFIVSDTGKFWVTVTDVNQCSASDTIEFPSILPLPVNFLKPVDSICLYEKLQISAIGNYNTYQWSTGSTSPVLTIEQPGKYQLTVKDANGCTGSDSIDVIQKKCITGVYIPTGFTPNGDGKNDLFKVRFGENITSFSLQVYNRWGQKIFQTAEVTKGWDGRLGNIIQPTGAYIWILKYKGAGMANEEILKGTVMLIK